MGRGLGVLGVALLLCGAARATVPNVMIDFEKYYGPNGVIIADITKPGTFPLVRFSSGGNPIYTNRAPDAAKGGHVAILPTPQTYGFRADFLISGVDFVTVDMGDYGQDADNLFLKAYDVHGNLLGQDTFYNPPTSYTYGTVTVTKGPLQPFISYVLFGSTGTYPNSVWADNFGFHAPGVPAVALLGLAPLVRLWARRRRR